MNDIKNLSLLLDFYELTMAAVYFKFKPQAKATFDLFVRELPRRRAFLIACGLDDVILYLKNFSFTASDMAYLKKLKFSADFLKYLSKLRFTGECWAVKEGTIVFPQEPIVRITAPIIEAQIVESYLLNVINLQTTIASKAVRVVLAADGRSVFDFSLRRTQGPVAGLKAARASYIAGCSGTSNVLAGKLFNINVVGTMAHSYVMSFRQEYESFRAYVQMYPQKAILLIDTYNYEQGIKNAMRVSQELKAKGYHLLGVRLDSGELIRQSKKIRSLLDKQGFSFVKIFGSGNLDEYKIQKLLRHKAKIDFFGVGTNMGVSADAPFCEVVYKISEISDDKDKFYPTMKLSEKKITYPGRKQIYRQKDKKGKFKKDILGLAKEKIAGEPLLVKMLDRGKVLYPAASLKETRSFVKEQLECLPPALKQINSRAVFSVVISRGLKRLAAGMQQRLKNMV